MWYVEWNIIKTYENNSDHYYGLTQYRNTGIDKHRKYNWFHTEQECDEAYERWVVKPKYDGILVKEKISRFDFINKWEEFFIW